MIVKMSRRNGQYEVQVTNADTGFSREGSFPSPCSAVNAIRGWQALAYA